jgi:2-iminobutanoate/2-iminopropanoate deaminase
VSSTFSAKPKADTILNIKTIAESEGASLKDCVRLTVYLSDLPRFAPMVDKAQAELWGGPPYPPQTMIEVKRLYNDDIAEIAFSCRKPRKGGLFAGLARAQFIAGEPA